MWEPLAPLARQDNQAPMACQEHPVQKDQADPKGRQEMMDSPELKVHRDPPELLAKRVSARNTVPSMVEFSSRTELVVKKEEINMSVYIAISLFMQWNLPFIQSNVVNFNCNKLRS